MYLERFVIACTRCLGTPMHGCPESGSLFTPIADDVVDARRHVNKTFFLGSCFLQEHDFLNTSQKTLFFLTSNLLLIRPSVHCGGLVVKLSSVGCDRSLSCKVFSAADH